MSSQVKLHEALVQRGLYSKSFEDFQEQFASDEKQAVLHQALTKEGLYSKDVDSFKGQFFPPAQQNLSAMFQPQGSSAPDVEPPPAPVDSSAEETSQGSSSAMQLPDKQLLSRMYQLAMQNGLSMQEFEQEILEAYPAKVLDLLDEIAPRTSSQPPRSNTPSLADVFSSPPPEYTEPEEMPEGEVSPMVAQIIGTSSPSSESKASEDSGPSEKEMWNEFKGDVSIDDKDFRDKEINNVRNYLSEERAGAEDLFINDEGVKFKEILGNLLGDDFDSYDGLTRAVVKGNIDDLRIVKLATGKKQDRKDFDWTDLIPAPRSVTFEEGQKFKEMIEVHLNELPSILSGADDRFTPRQVAILKHKIGPLVEETMKRGMMSHHVHGDGTMPLGALRMFAPQKSQ